MGISSTEGTSAFSILQLFKIPKWESSFGPEAAVDLEARQ